MTHDKYYDHSPNFDVLLRETSELMGLLKEELEEEEDQTTRDALKLTTDFYNFLLKVS